MLNAGIAAWLLQGAELDLDGQWTRLALEYGKSDPAQFWQIVRNAIEMGELEISDGAEHTIFNNTLAEFDHPCHVRQKPHRR